MQILLQANRNPVEQVEIIDHIIFIIIRFREEVEKTKKVEFICAKNLDGKLGVFFFRRNPMDIFWVDFVL